MTRLTPEPEEEIRGMLNDIGPSSEAYTIVELLAEIDALRAELEKTKTVIQVGVWDTLANYQFHLEGARKERDAALARVEKLRQAISDLSHGLKQQIYMNIAFQALTQDDKAAEK